MSTLRGARLARPDCISPAAAAGSLPPRWSPAPWPEPGGVQIKTRSVQKWVVIIPEPWQTDRCKSCVNPETMPQELEKPEFRHDFSGWGCPFSFINPRIGFDCTWLSRPCEPGPPPKGWRSKGAVKGRQDHVPWEWKKTCENTLVQRTSVNSPGFLGKKSAKKRKNESLPSRAGRAGAPRSKAPAWRTALLLAAFSRRQLSEANCIQGRHVKTLRSPKMIVFIQ